MSKLCWLVLALLCAVGSHAAAEDRPYDPATVETIAGEVTAVEQHAWGKGAARGLHVLLKTEKETVAVHLGPVWYLENQEVEVAVGDTIEVTGSRIQYEGKPAIVAARVAKGDHTLELRDRQGFPRWSGWRRAGPRRTPFVRARWWAAGSPYDRRYDPEKVETLSGEVASVGHFTPRSAIGRGVHVELKTEEGTTAVHLGPEWYIENQEVQLAAGDRIEVTGSRIEYEGKPAIVAARVAKGDGTLELRDAEGFPRWAGWRRAEPPRFAGEGFGRGARWWAAGSPYDRRYDPAKVETLSGDVASVGYFTPRSAIGRGVHLELKTEEGTIAVHLGPEWYLENQEVRLAAGDRIEVTGSRVEYEGKPAILAARVVKGDETLGLRDERGFPRWSGWRRLPRD